MKPNGRDYKMDPVLRRLVDLDHAALILACCLARGPQTEGFQNVDMHDEGDDDNRGPISDLSAPQAETDYTEAVPALGTDSGLPPTEEQQASTATPAVGGNVENVAPMEPRSQEDDDEVDLTIK